MLPLRRAGQSQAPLSCAAQRQHASRVASARPLGRRNDHMRTPFRLGRRQSYPWWFVGLIAVAGAVFYCLPAAKQTPELLLSLLGSIAAFFHFLYAQHNTNTERFVGLFKEFNARYDALNDDLNRIRELPADALKEPKDQQRLFDYFNLCAEEYLYFKAGYIDEDVWSSWLSGMGYFAANDAIRAIWGRELQQGSYYGFNLSLLPAAA